MTDKELIIYLAKELWGSVNGGEPNFDRIEQELKTKEIDTEDIFIY